MVRSLPDTNVWLALVEPMHVHHRVTRQWMVTNDLPESVAFCRSTQQGLLRLLTTAAVVAPYRNTVPSNEQAWAIYNGLLGDDRIHLVQEPGEMESRWRAYSTVRTASPKLWMDAYLAAFAIIGGYQLVSTDKAFKQFPGLDLVLLK